MTSASRQIVETCGTCQWWDNGVCLNYDSDMYQTGEVNTCPFWENYDWEMYGDG